MGRPDVGRERDKIDDDVYIPSAEGTRASAARAKRIFRGKKEEDGRGEDVELSSEERDELRKEATSGGWPRFLFGRDVPTAFGISYCVGLIPATGGEGLRVQGGSFVRSLWQADA